MARVDIRIARWVKLYAESKKVSRQSVIEDALLEYMEKRGAYLVVKDNDIRKKRELDKLKA